MAHKNPLGPLTVAVAAAIMAFRRVKFDGSMNAVVAGATDKAIGTTEHQTFAAGEMVAVNLRGLPGKREMVAAGVVAVGAKVYSAADGKVSATQATGAYEEGTAMSAAAADLDIITVLTEPGDNPKPA
ncbi:MAG TPA: capsid cement protein [Tepidisphaeraceae bacterium]|jgi:hypothetical protein|nr:capsid cement protein [Tepidisphaeraceae bacterium]